MRKATFAGRGFAALLMATTAMVVLSAGQASAADDSKPATTVGEVVVTAQKRTENIQNVPASVTAVGAKLIDRLQATSLQDYADYVPGLTVQSNGADANRLIIRGLSTGPDDISPTVGVYVDDAPFGSNSGYALGALLSPDVDPFDLDHVEVLRGPQGTLYGASTLGGLVKYVTKAPSTAGFDGHVRVDFTDEDGTGATGESFRAGFNLPISDKVALRISGYTSDQEGDLTNVRTGQDHLNGSAKSGGRFDLMIKPIDDLTIDLIAFTDSNKIKNSGLVLGDAVTLQPLYGQYAGYDYVNQHASTSYQVFEGVVKYRLPNGITASSTTSYSKFSVDEVSDDTTIFQPALGAFLGSILEFPGIVAPTTKKVTEEVRLESPTGDRLEWLVGGFFDLENSDYLAGINSVYEFGATPPSFLAPTVNLLANYETVSSLNRYSERAIFGNVTYHFTPTLDASLGLRYSSNDQHLTSEGSGYLALLGAIPTLAHASSSDNVWTESGDVRWHFEPDSMAYGRISRGYRPGGPNLTGPSFNPDTTWNYELGLKTTKLDGKLTADLALFYIDWRDIQLNFFNGTFVSIGNAGNARSDGLEFEGTYTPIPGLVFAANGAYTDAKITSLIPGAQGGAVVGDALPFDSKWTGALRADYFFPVLTDAEFNVGGSLRYRSSFNTTFPGDTGTRFYTLPSEFFVDLRAGIEFAHRFAVNFQVLNVGNERKLSTAAESLAVSQAAADAAGQPVILGYTPGRTYGLSLSAKF
ncbi:MAG TPA: TonB-dependent receptor [Caulobacteraceae bacterium]|jgi:outer membrane receptor protein involved in Fe transport